MIMFSAMSMGTRNNISGSVKFTSTFNGLRNYYITNC